MILRSVPLLCLGLALAPLSSAVAQRAPQVGDPDRLLLLAHWFRPHSALKIVVAMERQTVYRAEVTGPGTPAFRPQRRGRAAFVLEITGDTSGGRRWFEVHVFQAGPHVVSLSDRPPGATTLLQLYEEVAETRWIKADIDDQVRAGVSIAAGAHTGYRFDATGGSDPRGGADVEACFMIQTGGPFGTCAGLARQSFPDAGYTATWVFIEPRLVLGSGEFLWGRRTDLGAALRFSQAVSAGPRNLDPRLLGIGLFVVHRLSAGRRGWSVQAAWQHSRLDNAPETDRIDTDRFTAGVIWMP